VNIHDFIRKWEKADLSERSASQQHFLDLCEVFEQRKPAEADPTGEWFTFERGAEKTGGGDGWADVWKKGFFGWEYKGKHKDLDAAYAQLLLYRESLENPPLLVVCDMDRFLVHTNFTGTVKRIYEISLADMAAARNIEILRAVFHEPEKLRPDRTSEVLTSDAAATFAELAQMLRQRGYPSSEVAHFIDRLVFCLFAEDVNLLPRGLFTRLLDKAAVKPEGFGELTRQLFRAMAAGGSFGLDDIRHFNGNLFSDDTVLELSEDEIALVRKAASYDWSDIDPSIFGTLFERGLDPDKRSQLGAHYTSRADIETLVEPVVMAPLRREWEEARGVVETLLLTGQKKAGKAAKKLSPSQRRKAEKEASSIVRGFLERLSHVKILDPACGSGNFLYVCLQKLKDLEKEALLFAADKNLGSYFPFVGPWQLYGIEINPYAFELAQMTIWIGHLQWIRINGFSNSADPVLRPLDNFLNMDAILDLSDPESAKEPEWPRVDFIVGNPPFLGIRKMRSQLGDQYVERLFQTWEGRIPKSVDICCYWFEKARRHIEEGKCKRAGLLATQGIRGGANRKVVERIQQTGGVFFAESDRPWILDGANVHVSMIGFDNGDETTKTLDGRGTEAITGNLTDLADITQSVRLRENAGISFMGTTKQGPFDVAESLATAWLDKPNPNGRPNSNVLFPWLNGKAVTGRTDAMWIIDFFNLAEKEASQYELPFAHAAEHVRKMRESRPRDWYRSSWWQLYAQRPVMRKALKGLERFPVTPRVSKHRMFAWIGHPIVPDCALIVFARSDDYFFGVLHSRFHEVWALRLGTRLETRPRYTPTTCFETFALPRPTKEQEDAVAAAAKELDDLRNRWLNPPEWTREEILEFPGSVDGPWARYVTDADSSGIGTVRYPRTVARDDECAARLKKRTLTNLYNERPTWLEMAHKRLDEAVASAYGWPADLSDEEILERLLALNLERAGKQ